MPNSQWDGRTERRGQPNDHDNMVRLLVSVENHVKNFEKHIAEDNTNFAKVESKIWEHAKYIYVGIGAVAVIQIIIGMKH